jgi:iron complex transport system substrate-binding protein
MNTKFILFPLLCSLLVGCQESKKETKTNFTENDTRYLKYAEGFKVSYEGSSKFVEVRYPYPGAVKGYNYLLVQKGDSIPPHTKETIVITVPIDNLVCTSTTHIPLLDYIGETDKLIGFPTTDYISSEKMRRRIDLGNVTDLGIDKGMNLEVLFSLKPSLVMGYTMNSDLGQLKKIKELGIPIVINAEYLEKHPLGRAEWIKFMALFLNKEKQADSVFQIIENNYLKTLELVKNISSKPPVLSGIVYGDTWFLPAGQNYAARLLKDAGCNYLWSDNESNDYLELSFESVYGKAKDSELWIGVGAYQSLHEMEAAEPRYAKFRPFKEYTVYSNNIRKGAKGGSEFLELGYLRPDIILMDLVKIAHPGLLPDYELYFHKRLK